MYHGYRRFLYLALSVCCIFSMLFLDICVVNAEGFSDLFDSILVTNYSQSNSFTILVTPTSSTSYEYQLLTAGGYSGRGTTSSTGSTTTSGSFYINGQTYKSDNEYYQLHFKVPFNIYAPPDSGASVTMKDTYGFVAYGDNPTCSVGNIQNVCYTSGDNIIYNQNNQHFPVYFYKGYELFDSNAGNTYVGRPCFLEFDYILYQRDLDLDDNDTVSATITFNSIEFVGHVNNNLDLSVVEVQDSVTRREVTEISDTATDTNNKITNFFGSFFENIINSFKSLFIPEDGYFTEWFNRLNTLLADKLGMLYAPFDLVISTLTAIMNADSSENGIPFPGIKWEDTWLVEPFTFTFSSLGEDMSDLRDTVYFATDVVLLFAFLYLLEEKIRHILED